MARAQVEHDFLGMEKPISSPLPLPQPRFDRRQSFRGITKINPEIVKSIIASAGKPESTSLHGCPTPTSGPDPHNLAQLPVFRPHLSRGNMNEKEKEEETEIAPMTIFYKGAVSVFDLPQDKAEFIMKFANEKSCYAMNVDDQAEQNSNGQAVDVLESMNDGDLPIKRKKSLQRFFEKRKERLMSVSPYPVDHVAQINQKSLA